MTALRSKLTALSQQWRDEVNTASSARQWAVVAAKFECADQLSALLASETHRCAGCGHRWEGPLTVAEYCGDCHRIAFKALHPKSVDGLPPKTDETPDIRCNYPFLGHYCFRETGHPGGHHYRSSESVAPPAPPTRETDPNSYTAKIVAEYQIVPSDPAHVHDFNRWMVTTRTWQCRCGAERPGRPDDEC